MRDHCLIQYFKRGHSFLTFVAKCPAAERLSGWMGCDSQRLGAGFEQSFGVHAVDLADERRVDAVAEHAADVL